MYQYNFPEIHPDHLILGQVMKIREEAHEVEEECAKVRVARIMGEEQDYESFAEETFDLIHACETLIRMLPLNESDINRIHGKVINKNRVRGYYGKDRL